MFKCSGCGVLKSRDDFYRQTHRRDKIQSRCKECYRQYQRDHRDERREWERRHAKKPGVAARLAAQSRERRKNNPEKYRAKARAEYTKRGGKEFHGPRSWTYQIKSKFGLTPAEYTAMAERQGGVCGICGGNRSARVKRLVVDHCHRTGTVRGLLCSNCNYALGQFSDSPGLLMAALAYLARSAKEVA
jgi:hypothetical protein